MRVDNLVLHKNKHSFLDKLAKPEPTVLCWETFVTQWGKFRPAGNEGSLEQPFIRQRWRPRTNITNIINYVLILFLAFVVSLQPHNLKQHNLYILMHICPFQSAHSIT